MLIFKNAASLFNYLSFSNAVKAIPSLARFASSKGSFKFADPTYDMTFKMLFGTEQNKDLTMHFLNSLLFVEKEVQIKDLDFIESTLDVSHLGHLPSAIDIKCRLHDGRDVLVEMQRQPTIYFLPRTQYYMARSMASHLREGQGKLHIKVPETYLLSICKESVFTNKFGVVDMTGKRVEFDKFETTVYPVMEEYSAKFPNNKMYWKFFELSKFPSKIAQDSKLWSSPKYQWLNFLKTCVDSKEIPEKYDEHIKKAYIIMEQHNWSAEKKEAYDIAMISSDELDADVIKEAGKIEGIAKGEKTKAFEIAKRMLSKNKPIEEIVEFTGLSEGELQVIQKGNNNDSSSSSSNSFGGNRGYHSWACQEFGNRFASDIEDEQNITNSLDLDIEIGELHSRDIVGQDSIMHDSSL